MTRARRKILDAVERDGHRAVAHHGRCSVALVYALANGTKPYPSTRIVHAFAQNLGIELHEWFETISTNVNPSAA